MTETLSLTQTLPAVVDSRTLVVFVNSLAVVYTYSNLLQNLPQLSTMSKCKQTEIALSTHPYIHQDG